MEKKYIKLKTSHKLLTKFTAKVKEQLEKLFEENYLIIDTETEPRDNNRKNRDIYNWDLVLLQIGNKHKQYLIPVTNEKALKFLKRKLRTYKGIFIGHNIKYDYQILKRFFGRIPFKNIHDTMVSEYILNMNRNVPKGFYSLKGTFERYFKNSHENPYNEEDGTAKDIRLTFSSKEVLTEEQIRYAALDVITTSMVYNKQLEHLRKEKLEETSKFENKFTRVLAEMELTGMPLDIDRWIELDEWTEEEVAKRETVLREKHPNIKNWNSQKQVSVYFKELGIPVSITDQDSGEQKLSVSKAVLEKHKEAFPIVKEYLEYKMLTKLKGTYGINFLKHVSVSTERIHTNFLQILNTGRTSSSSPNMQNIFSQDPKVFSMGLEWRKAFRASEKRIFVVADFANQEARILADKCGEDSLVKTLNEGGDLHSLNASKIFGKEVTKTKNKELRSKGKTATFALNYGAGPSKIATSLNIPMSEAKQIFQGYFKGYPKLKAYYDSRYQELLENGYIIVDSLGRKAYFDMEDVPESVLAAYKRNCYNTPIQGTGATMSKYAGILILEEIEKRKLTDKMSICLLIHDEYVIEADVDIQYEARDIVSDCMNKAGKIFSPTVPTYADAIITKVWLKD